MGEVCRCPRQLAESVSLHCYGPPVDERNTRCSLLAGHEGLHAFWGAREARGAYMYVS